MSKKARYNTLKELIYWSYSNLAMAHSAVIKKQDNYSSFNFMIRSRLYKGLNTGTMNIRSFFDDEKIKLQSGNFCNYCGSNNSLALDHILPKKYILTDNAENLIFACKFCNSSKGKKDLMEWMAHNNSFLPLMIIRRYLKLVYFYSFYNNLLEITLSQLESMTVPFNYKYIPIDFPQPSNLKLNITDELPNNS